MIKLYLIIGVGAVSLAAGGFFVYDIMNEKVTRLEIENQAKEARYEQLSTTINSIMTLQEEQQDKIDDNARQATDNMTALSKRTDLEFEEMLLAHPDMMTKRINEGTARIFEGIKRAANEQ